MKFTKLVPQVFYPDMRVALKTFVDCLEFTVVVDQISAPTPFCVVRKDGLDMMVFESKEYAEIEHPEFRLVTDNIEEVYERVSSRFPELLHPNLSKVTLRPWGAKEFAILDKQIGIIIQQW
jgi:hypothetical protein